MLQQKLIKIVQQSNYVMHYMFIMLAVYSVGVLTRNALQYEVQSNYNFLIVPLFLILYSVTMPVSVNKTLMKKCPDAFIGTKKPAYGATLYGLSVISTPILLAVFCFSNTANITPSVDVFNLVCEKYSLAKYLPNFALCLLGTELLEIDSTTLTIYYRDITLNAIQLVLSVLIILITNVFGDMYVWSKVYKNITEEQVIEGEHNQ